MESRLQGPGGGWGGHRGHRHTVVNLWEAEDKLVGRKLVARLVVRVAFRQGVAELGGVLGAALEARVEEEIVGPREPVWSRDVSVAQGVTAPVSGTLGPHHLAGLPAAPPPRSGSEFGLCLGSFGPQL